MSSIKKNLYHIGLSNQGFVLSGAPRGGSGRRFSRSMGDAPANGANPTQYDAEYQDASSFIPWAQVDWSGGFQFDKWEDNAGFENGSSIEYISRYKQITLLNDQATVKDFGAGFTFGAAVEYQRDTVGMLIGVTKSGGASQLWKISTGLISTQITGGTWSNVNAVNSMDVSGAFAFIGCTVSSGSALKKYNASAVSDITLTGDLLNALSVTMVKRIGGFGGAIDRLYIAGGSTTSTGSALMYSDDQGSTWTTIIKGTGTGRTITSGDDNLGTLYFLIQDGSRTELWWCNDTTVTQIYVWDNLVSPNIQSWLGTVYILGLEAGRLRKYSWNGSIMKTVFEQKLTNLDLDASPMITYRNNQISYGLTYDQTYNFPSYNFKYSSNKCYPFMSFGASSSEVPWFYGISGSNLIVSSLLTTFQTTGNVYTGLFYGKKAAVDKLWNSVTVGFAALLTNQTIAVDYSTDNEATWNNIDTITPVSGETERQIYFANNIISKRIQLRFTLTSGGSNTPTVFSYVCRFLNMPDSRYYWTFRLDCRDKLTLLDGKTFEPKRASELREIIFNGKRSKSITELQDLDYAECKLSGSLSSTSTTITVDTTNGFPQQGRLKIDQEEIFYTGISATQFTGCTRGARGTRANSHSDTTRVHNGYNVVIQGVTETNLVIATPKVDESVLSVTLLEV